MTFANYNAMNLDKLRRYVLTNRDDVSAFHLYIDRSKAVGRMSTIDPTNPQREVTLEQELQQASGEAESN